MPNDIKDYKDYEERMSKLGSSFGEDVVMMMRGQIAVSWERKAGFWRRVSCCLFAMLLIVATYFLGTAL